VLFAWKKSLDEDDYHLYEMNVASGAVRQLTFGLGFADYEGAYMPNGHIVFNSTRCVQTVDCWWTEVSNFYTCDGDGRYLRRLGFDQVHSNYPTVTPDGRVLCTRWEYSDRGQIFPQGLFQMNPDGTGQTVFYGNNTWFPTAILHARAIPGTQKAVAIFSGHHTIQKGWLGILDPSRGRQENQGAQLIAPVRETEAVRVDAYGQEGDQFQYPYPLSETEFIVAFRPADSDRRFGIYWMDKDGRRELLASDPAISCNQPVPLAPRCCHRRRMTRSQDGSLALSCTALSSATPCRFIPALSLTPRQDPTALYSGLGLGIPPLRELVWYQRSSTFARGAQQRLSDQLPSAVRLRSSGRRQPAGQQCRRFQVLHRAAGLRRWEQPSGRDQTLDVRRVRPVRLRGDSADTLRALSTRQGGETQIAP
jgi:hypothetical protein